MVIFSALALIVSPWWQPIAYGLVSQWLTFDDSNLQRITTMSTLSGWGLLFVGTLMYFRVSPSVLETGLSTDPTKDSKSRMADLRLSGARIEVVILILCRSPEAQILLGLSPYHEMWMPPQEGVNIGETLKEAIMRCLETECGLDVPENRKDFDRQMHLRSIRYAGMVDLPIERHGERLVADDAVGTPLEEVVLIKKAYWFATIILGNRQDINPEPDGRELLDFRWFPLSKAVEVIQNTNHAPKATLLIECISSCRKDLHGV